MIIALFLTFCILLSWITILRESVKEYSDSEILHTAFLLTIFQITSTIFVWGILLKHLDQTPILLTSIFIIFILCRGRPWRLVNDSVFVLKKFGTFLKAIISYRLLRILFVLILVQQIWTIGRIHYTSPNVLDTLTYHLPISIKWYQEKKIDLYEPAPIERMNYSTKVPKALNFWVLLFAKDITYIELSQYFGYILLLLSAYTLLRKFKVPTYWAFAGTCVIMTLPLIIIENYTLQDHVLLTAMHFSVIKVLLDVVENRINIKKGLILSGVGVGLLLGTKFSAPAHVGAIIITLSAVYLKQLKTIVTKKNILPFIVASVLVICIGGIWYLNNYINYGSFFGPTLPQATRDNKFLSNILSFPLRILDAQHGYSPDLVYISGFGIQFFSFGFLLGSLSLLKKKIRKKRLLLIGSSIMLLCIYFFLYFTPYNYRLFLFFPISFLICAFSVIPDLKRKTQKILALVMIFGLAFTTLTTLYIDYLKDFTQNLNDSARSTSSERSIVRFDYTSDKFNNDKSFLFIDQYIPKHETLSYITQSQNGYDDNIIAAYYDKTLVRKAIWLGNIDTSNYISTNGRPTSKLVTYLLSHNINYLHNNIVFYYQLPKTLNITETPLIELTKNLYYLDSSSQIIYYDVPSEQDRSLNIENIPTGKKIIIPIDNHVDSSLTLEVTFTITSADSTYFGLYLNNQSQNKRLSPISNIYLKAGESKAVTYVLSPSDRQLSSELIVLPKNQTSEVRIDRINTTAYAYREGIMNVDFLKELNSVNKGIFEESQ